MLLGAALLWFGWFGFNAGSQLAADGVSTAAFINTHIATAAAAMSWIMVEWIRFKKPTAVGFASGAVAGLVAITPACGWVDATAALLIGLIVSPICISAISLKGKLNKFTMTRWTCSASTPAAGCGAPSPPACWANSTRSTPACHQTPAASAWASATASFSGRDGASLSQLWAQIGAIAITVVCAVFSTFDHGVRSSLS